MFSVRFSFVVGIAKGSVLRFFGELTFFSDHDLFYLEI